MQFFAGPLKELAEYEEIQKKRTEKQGMSIIDKPVKIVVVLLYGVLDVL